jgi:hypothetical protein
MKKIVFLLMMITIVITQVVGQVRSCVTFDPNRDLNGFKNVILTWKDPFIRSKLWPAYVANINESLGTHITCDEKGIRFILENTQEYEYSYFNHSDYLNGVRIGNVLEYRDVAGHQSSWAVFVYGGQSCMYAKIGCCNPQKIKVQPKLVVEKKPQLQPEPQKPETVYVEAPQKQEVVVVEQPRTIIVENQNYDYGMYPTSRVAFRLTYGYGYGGYSGRYYQRNYYSNNYYRGSSFSSRGNSFYHRGGYSSGGNYSSNRGTMSSGRGFSGGGNYSSGRGTMSSGRATMSGSRSGGSSGGGRSR